VPGLHCTSQRSAGVHRATLIVSALEQEFDDAGTNPHSRVFAINCKASLTIISEIANMA
jgi:hypothetical protein